MVHGYFVGVTVFKFNNTAL